MPPAPSEYRRPSIAHFIIETDSTTDKPSLTKCLIFFELSATRKLGSLLLNFRIARDTSTDRMSKRWVAFGDGVRGAGSLQPPEILNEAAAGGGSRRERLQPLFSKRRVWETPV
jgi:hypothetical protein